MRLWEPSGYDNKIGDVFWGPDCRVDDDIINIPLRWPPHLRFHLRMLHSKQAIVIMAHFDWSSLGEISNGVDKVKLFLEVAMLLAEDPHKKKNDTGTRYVIFTMKKKEFVSDVEEKCYPLDEVLIEISGK